MVSRFRFSPCLFTFALLAVSTTCAAAPPDNPLLGVWSYVPAGSSFSGRAPYRSATLTISIEAEGIRTTEEVVTASGAVFKFEYVDAMDGSFVAVAGHPYYDSESTVWVDKLTAIRRERRGGEDTGTTVMQVSADGKFLVAKHNRTVPDGHLYTAEVNWKREEL
jgi:hypothetical protein